MKKTGVLNRDLSELIASMGHRDFLVVADAGLPIPPGVRCIDLSVSRGIPAFCDVLRAVLSELQVEEAMIASEMVRHSPQVLGQVRELLGSTPIDSASHEEFKSRTAQARAIVRTGEFTPFANVILVSGVVF